MPRSHRPTLDCQSCETVLKELTPAQAQRVADNPYAFVAFCPDCAAHQK